MRYKPKPSKSNAASPGGGQRQMCEAPAVSGVNSDDELVLINKFGHLHARRICGRQKGALNKSTLARQKALADLVVDSKDPVSFFTSIMRDETAPFEKREAAADRLLPYYHPRLAAIEARTGGETHEDRLERLRELLAEDE